MKKLMTALFLVLTFTTQLVLAHGDHYELGASDAAKAAKAQVEKLVAEKQLPDSWKEVSANSEAATTKSVAGKKRWSVTLENSKETDASKKKVEMLLTPAGKFVSFQFVK